MASRKEERERLRQEREAREAQERTQERKRLILGYVVAGLISAAVVVGIVFAIAGGGDEEGTGGGEVAGGDVQRVYELYGIVPEGVEIDGRESVEAPTSGDFSDLDAAADAAGCELLLEQKDEGSTHIPPNRDVPDYKANPPTSGDHSPDPLTDGAFTATPSPLNYIHALEHGRIQIQYQSSLPENEQLQLLGVFDEDPAGMIAFPNDDQPYLIAVTAWRQTMGCDSFKGEATLDAIRAFRDTYRARGPERIQIG